MSSPVIRQLTRRVLVLVLVNRDWATVQLYSCLAGPSEVCLPHILTGNKMLCQHLSVANAIALVTVHDENGEVDKSGDNETVECFWVPGELKSV